MFHQDSPSRSSATCLLTGLSVPKANQSSRLASHSQCPLVYILYPLYFISSSCALLPLAGIKRQAECLCLKCDLATLGKIKHVPLRRVHLLTCLIRDVELTVDNNLHLVVRVLVHQRCAS